MEWRLLAELLTRRGYRRQLVDFSPCFVLRGPPPPEPPAEAHIISVVDLMDAVALGQWDNIAALTRLSLVEVIGIMEGGA